MTPARYEPLVPGRPLLGEIAVLPWDSETFGFPVGEWRFADARAVARERPEATRSIQAWVERAGLELLSARVPARDAEGRLLLSLLGFEFIDCAISVEIPELQAASPPPPRHAIRVVAPEDQAEIVRIAEEAFQLDRYHADARFPKRLPELRHRRWMRELLNEPAARAQTWTIGEPGRPAGLITAVFDDDAAEILLAAVDVRRHGGGLGFSLFAGALAALKQAGVRRCVSKQYAANTAIMNVFAGVGFRFAATDAVYHWHPERAPHLRSLEDVYR